MLEFSFVARPHFVTSSLLPDMSLWLRTLFFAFTVFLRSAALVDGEFLSAALEGSVQIKEQIPKFLQAEDVNPPTRYQVSQCAIPQRVRVLCEEQRMDGFDVLTFVSQRFSSPHSSIPPCWSFVCARGASADRALRACARAHKQQRHTTRRDTRRAFTTKCVAVDLDQRAQKDKFWRGAQIIAKSLPYLKCNHAAIVPPNECIKVCMCVQRRACTL